MSVNETVERMSQMLTEKKKEEVIKVMTPILEDIANYPMPHGVIQEEFFVRVFLPYFAGEISESDFPKGISMHTWNQIAGNMNNPVDVVDVNNNVLFTVPPINDLSYIVQNPDSTYKPMASAGTYAETLRSSARPDEAAMADKVIARELNSRIPARLRSVKEERYREWAKIFLRYGYFLPKENESDSNPVTDAHADIFDDMEWE